MAQLKTSQQARAFYRQTFEIKSWGKSVYKHTLLVNPTDISIDEPNRASVTQTLGGTYVALFGQGLHTVTISGTTGFSARANASGTIMDGYTEIKNLRELMYRNFIKTFNPQDEMFWYDWENAEYYKIMPLSFRLQRSVSQPMMYRYEIQFTTIVRLGTQTKPSTNNLLSAVSALDKAKNLTYASSSISEATSKVT